MKHVFYLLFLFLASNSFAQDEVVYDVDSNIYHPIKIGSQIWLKENLRVRHYNNGNVIKTTENPGEYVAEEKAPKYWWYGDNNAETAEKYGLLYTFHAATDARKVCPAGWHVPSDAEWTTLEKTVGGRSKAAYMLKSNGGEWKNKNLVSKKAVGFEGLPTGDHSSEGGSDYFGITGYWWTSTENAEANAWGRRMMYDGKNVNRTIHMKFMAFSVRCVKD